MKESTLISKVDFTEHLR